MTGVSLAAWLTARPADGGLRRFFQFCGVKPPEH